MADTPNPENGTEGHEGTDSTEARRDFMRKAAKIAVTTPAVTLLLAAGTKQRALAKPISG